nr:hypothetical protein [Tanacetum cinerariifolium]
MNVSGYSITGYDSTEESTTVCSTTLPPLEKLADAEPQTGPKTIKSIFKSCSTRKAKISKDVIINEPNNSSALSKGTHSMLVN